MKALIKKFIPSSLLFQYRKFKSSIEQRTNLKKPTEDVFTNIYERNKWGGKKGEFFSGDGSRDEKLISSYLSMLTAKAKTEGFTGKTFLDLGCGDFRIGEKLTSLTSNYIGADIVKPLIEHHKKKYERKGVTFVHLNIIEDKLPEADVCFVRQVLQHLSNSQIQVVLPKLKKFRWVFITEHYPSPNSAIIPNKDKVQGSDVRVYMNSGVYLSEAPFNIPPHQLELVLEVPGAGLDEKIDKGVIRTFLYKPLGK